MNELIVIEHTKIRQDSQGRYCLNDLHQASGGEQKHRPSLWLSNQQTQELVQELSEAGNPASVEKSPVNTLKGGDVSKQGTYVCKELVYAYAMWVSPKFHLLVIRTFDQVRKQQNAPALPDFSDPIASARAWADAKEAEMKALLETKQLTAHLQSLESYFRNGISPFEFVKGLNGVNSLKIGDFLIHKNWLYQDNREQKRVKAYARDLYLTEENIEINPHGQEPFISYKPVLLKKGAAKLYEWYTQGQLPMKKNWNNEFTSSKAVGL